MQSNQANLHFIQYYLHHIIKIILTNNKIKPIIGKVFLSDEAAKVNEFIELWKSAGKIKLEI